MKADYPPPDHLWYTSLVYHNKKFPFGEIRIYQNNFQVPLNLLKLDYVYTITPPIDSYLINISIFYKATKVSKLVGLRED